MSDKKFLDMNGVSYLYHKLSLKDYPNNEVLKAVIDSIDEIKVNKNDLLDMIYPVGSIYMSVNVAAPETLFGGKWEQIKDTFLLSAGDNYAVGTTGGEATHTLSVNEMPSHIHSHPFSGHTWTWGNKEATIRQTEGAIIQGGGTDKNELVSFQNLMDKTNATGGSAAHNNMPPYLTVYVWKRIA